MIEKLLKLQENSYAKYSNYRVSAIVVTKDLKEFNGVNVENASYGACICAERVALTSMIAAGYKKGDVKELNLMVSSGSIGTPCFLCRQTISELCDKETIINCYSTKGEVKTYTVRELCPHPFSEEDLK